MLPHIGIRLNEFIGAAIIPKTKKTDTYSWKSIIQSPGSDFRDCWTEQINTERKMRTYRKFKTSFVAEDYLCIKNNAHRKPLTKLRVGAHRLAIRGRYSKPPTPGPGGRKTSFFKLDLFYEVLDNQVIAY